MHKRAPLTPPRPDALRWAIFLALLGSNGALAQNGLEAASGPGGTPIIDNGHGVPVIEIVPPNASGLSHNQFLDYNVAKPGVVLNNALQDGQSQLAGALAANPQFQGQAASTILNEVISRNASLIEGPQEIFGRPADYILANPNGITLNGGSFINTTRAGFVVGTPELQDEQLRYFNTLNSSATLQVLGGGQSNAEGALDLIAPRLDSTGPLTARDNLGITVGRNRLDSASGQVIEHLPGTPSSIDAKLFGALRAGRIRMVSTAEGAGVHMGPVQVHAKHGIDIRSAGDLLIEGQADAAAQLHSEQGALALGAEHDLTLRAVEGRAEQITAKAGKKLTLDSKSQAQVDRERENWKNKAWFVTYETYDRTRTTTAEHLRGTQLQAGDSLGLQSGKDMRLAAATLDAGVEMTLDSGANLDIVAGTNSQRVEEQVRHRKHLWRGDRDTDQYSESAHASSLNAARMQVKATDTLNLQGSTMHSRGSLDLQARQVHVGTTALAQRNNQDGYRGDLVSGAFFGKRQGTDSQGQAMAGSSITADGKLNVGAEQAAIKGSTVRGKEDAVLYSTRGALVIEEDHARTTSTERNRDSKLFGLFASDRGQTTRQDQVLVSDIGSDSNLRLASAEELRIQGAKVQAGQHLQVEAKGDVLVASAQALNESETRDQQRGLTASARQTQQAEGDKPGSRQYTAGVAYQVTTRGQKTRDTTQLASELKGATVALASDARLHVNGAKVQASAGDLDVKAQQVTLGATRNTHESTTSTRQSGGGLTVTGGIDRLGSQFEGHDQRTVVTERDSKAQRSELQASGNLKLAADTLVSESARVTAGNTLKVDARHIDNRAVQDTHERKQERTDWSASLGASVEYRDLTRPIERVVLGEEAARFQQASPEDAMTAPSAGADMTVEHLKQLENQRRGIAQVSELAGAQVEVKADTINDQGTAWRANAGQLQIDAQQHTLGAAENTQEDNTQRLAVSGDLRVDTSTGSDLNGRAAGKGGSLAKQATASTAVPGSLYGQQGIQVQLGSDGLYEGARLQGGDGDVMIHSAGNLALTQATDRTEQLTRQLDGNAWAKLGNRPGSTGGDARGYLDHTQKHTQQATAQVAQVDAKGEVRLSSGGDLLLEGTRIGSREAKVGDIRLDSGGTLQVKAASNTQEASGGTLGGGLELAATQGSSTGGGIGGHFSHGKQEEQARQAVDAQFASSGKLTLASQAREDLALHMQGLQASAAAIELKAANGGMLLEASANQERRNNLDITAGAGFNIATGATDTRSLHGRAKVELDKRDNLTWNASTLRGDTINVHSRGDSRIEGASLEAGRIDGSIGGDLLVASRKDSVDSLTVKGDARLSQEKNPQGYVNAATSMAGPLGGKVKEKAADTLSKVDPGLSPTVAFEVSQAKRDTVAHQAVLKASDGIDLKVGGDARLVGARLQSAAGQVALSAGSVSRETLNGSDYRRDVSVDFSNAPVDLGTAVAELSKGKGAAEGENALDLGLLRTSGHNRSEQWTSSVQGKRE
ncbi:filamentous hemagglutinin N-terminal domain-containing protein [Pantoea sp. Ap-967]|uniref:hemagglutinin repeat-containing protein n=1 Tax=Pantoea sp. Ap-967 TaxID=2608362 RepID=UPI001423E7F0|nr:hemagglutinin repeat-containing protein [Pantoea sp. Ap-967]NIE74490.1 filamentous hemagglutinin N-terminal domain-containing protein [Pantoea sp. Ap-967]